MKVSVNTGEFVRELNLLRLFAAREASIPVLGNVLVEAAGERIKLSATDLELSLECGCPASVESGGVITIPARLLFDYARLLTGETLVLDSKPSHWESLVCGAARARIAGMSCENFPVLAVMPEEASEIPAGVLASLIERTEFLCSKEESRFTLRGALLVTDGGYLKMVATDGHRLSLSAMEWPGGLNAGYVKDFLEASQGRAVEMRLAGKDEAVRWRYLVMPMRV